MPTHRRHRHHHHRRQRLKSRERNFLAAIGSMIVIVTLSTALAEPRWFSLHGGGCKKDGEVANHLGISEFFYMFGKFQDGATTDKGNILAKENIYYYGSGTTHKLLDCVTLQAVKVIKAIIALCFMGILCSLFAFILDLLGPNARLLKFIRRHGVLNIITVFLCVTVSGFCYWVAVMVEDLQKRTKIHKGSKVSVKFDVSFYLMAGAGAMSVITVACNLLCIRWYITNGSRRSRHRDTRLLDDYDGPDIPLPIPSPPHSQEGSSTAGTNIPPPPAYEP